MDSMGAMIARVRHHRRIAIAVVCFASTAVGAMCLGHGGVVGNIAFLLALEAIPLAALVVAGDELPWWLGVSASAGIAAFTAASWRSVENSTSSTAVIVIPFIPLTLLVAVPCLVSICDVVALIGLRARGGRIAAPRRGDLVLAAALGIAGFFAFFVFGLLAGLLTAFAVWAHRARGEARLGV